MKLAKAYKLSRRLKFRGLDVSIETDKGELRHWYDPHNKKKGSTKMTHAYGYIRRTKGVDGDHLDVYVGPNELAKNVYVVHQMKAPDFKKYDEDKALMGFDSAEAAKAAYLHNFDDPRFFGSMSTIPFEKFKEKALATFEEPRKVAHRMETAMNSHLKTAYWLGTQDANLDFDKHAMAPPPEAGGMPPEAGAMPPEGMPPKEMPPEAAPNLGDPNFWGGGTPEEGAAPATAEEAVSLLPAGTFQGLNTRMTPDGQKSIGVKVTPDALAAPEALQAMFQSEPGVRVEITAPDTPAGVTSFRET